MTVPKAEAPPPRKIRILCLHGYLQNAEIFRQRIGSMRKALKSKAELVFIDAPYLAQDGVSAEDARESGGNAESGRSWWHFENIPSARPSTAASYSGWETSQQTITDALKEHQPIDCLLGFSQGATATALFLAHSSNKISAEIVPKSAIVIGGFMPRDAGYAAVLKNAQPMPTVKTLFVTGEKDQLVPPSRSEELWNCFGDRTVYVHPGAHMVPTCSGEFKQIMLKVLEESREWASEQENVKIEEKLEELVMVNAS